MDDLIAFVTARLDEDERFAKIARLAQKHREQLRREVTFKRAILAQWEHSPAGSPVLTNVLYTSSPPSTVTTRATGRSGSPSR